MAQPDESDVSCKDDTTTIGMMECSEKRYKAEDLKLNSLYEQLREKIGHGSMSEKYLIGAQRAWVKFRDNTCQYEASGVEGGTAHGVYVGACLVTQTKIRNDQLQTYLNCTSNDCP